VYMHDVWIDGNMEKAYQYCEFSKLEMVQLARNAVDMCWAETAVKHGIYAELDAVDCDKNAQ
jgi:adenosine deaminase